MPETAAQHIARLLTAAEATLRGSAVDDDAEQIGLFRELSDIRARLRHVGILATATQDTGERHITSITGPDPAGQWGWECSRGDDDASGYDDPGDVVAAAQAHGPLAADSHRPSWADIGEQP